MGATKSSGEEQSVLTGKRVVVTRSPAQASKLSSALRELGAVPVEFPTIQIVPPEDSYAALDADIARLERFDWIIFTSTNAVSAFYERLRAAGRLRLPAHVRLAAVGSATVERLAACGLPPPDLVPKRFVGESLLAALRETGISGKRCLLPRADIARESLPQGLKEAGAWVSAPHAYRTAAAEPDAEALAELRAGVDIITFTSGSTVRNFIEQLGIAYVRQLADRVLTAAIGPMTARAAQDLGLQIDIVAREHTIPGLIAAIIDAYERGNVPR